MTIVDDLLANAGLYIGIDSVAGVDARGAARMVVTALPGAAAVSLDYEILNPAHPDNLRAHVEHTLIGRTHSGGVVMVITDTHAGAISILHETDPGVFEAGDERLPYPMKVVVSVPAKGRIRHAWWYGRPGTEASERDVSELRLAD